MLQKLLLSPKMSAKGNLNFYLGEALIAFIFISLIFYIGPGLNFEEPQIYILKVLSFFWLSSWGVICISYYPSNLEDTQL